LEAVGVEEVEVVEEDDAMAAEEEVVDLAVEEEV
jgi:hypothetical protein